MYLDYSKLALNTSGMPEHPTLLLQTMAGEAIGVLPGVYDLKLNIKFSEPSEMSFKLPAMLNGVPNPMYDLVTGYRLIYTQHYGVYVVMNPEKESDGISDIKSIKAYSIEKTLDTKRFFLEEGKPDGWQHGNGSYPGIRARVECGVRLPHYRTEV